MSTKSKISASLVILFGIAAVFYIINFPSTANVSSEKIILSRNSTHILRPGKSEIIASLAPINYKTPNGTWHAYNTTLVASQDNNYAYQIKSSDHQGYFKDDPTQKDFVMITREDAQISYTLGPLAYTNGNTRELISQPRQVKAEVTKNKIIYKNIFGDGIDLQFLVLNSRIKKELVIRSPENLPTPSISTPSLSFELIINVPDHLNILYLAENGQDTTWDYKSTLTIDNPVSIQDTNPQKTDRDYNNVVDSQDNTLFSLLPAVAFDSSEEKKIISSNVDTRADHQLSFNLSKNGDTLSSEVVAPLMWLEQAVFPVIIDPTVEFQVEADTDDVTEFGSTYNQSDVSLGGNSSQVVGLRFTDVSVPNGATIDSAQLEVRANPGGWINFSFIIRAEDVDDSTTFSSGNRPSSRTVTSASVTHSSNVNWNDGSWYLLDEMDSVVQEVVDRAGWQSGNAMSFIIQGNDAEFSRKWVYDYSDDPNSAPKLHITYTGGGDTPTPTPTITPTPTPPPTEWYHPDWTRRIPLQVDPANVPSTQTDFPLYVDLSDMPASFFSEAKSDGSDIIVVDDENVKLARELVFYENSGSGELYFKAPAVSGSEATNFYIYYNNPGASETNSTAVWSNGYHAVYHMHASTGTTLVDSTSGGYSLSKKSSTEPVPTPGAFGNAQDYATTGDYASSSTAFTGTSTMTYSAWIYPESGGGNNFGRFIHKRNSSSGTPSLLIDNSAGTRLLGFEYSYSTGNKVWRSQSNALTLNAWNFAAITFNNSSSDNMPVMYVNASNVNASVTSNISASTTPSTDDNYLFVGNRSDLIRTFDGPIDEVRIASVIRSADWLMTEYNNLSDPDDFYSLGGVENPISVHIGGKTIIGPGTNIFSQ